MVVGYSVHKIFIILHIFEFVLLVQTVMDVSLAVIGDNITILIAIKLVYEKYFYVFFQKKIWNL